MKPKEQNIMQTAAAIQTHRHFAIPAETLQRCHLVVDGNAHRPDLIQPTLPSNCGALFAEAMLPQIRMIAQMIAASRHDFSKQSPSMFADEADWFAARILVLQARAFHLDITLRFMLDTANRRAQAFAAKHHLAFTPAKIRMSLHAGRPDNLLIMECALDFATQDEGLINNRRRLAALIGDVL